MKYESCTLLLCAKGTRLNIMGLTKHVQSRKEHVQATEHAAQTFRYDISYERPSSVIVKHVLHLKDKSNGSVKDPVIER